LESLNLLSLVSAKEDLSADIFSKYLANFSAKTSDDELDDLTSFVQDVQEQSEKVEVFESFYIGYSIPQISKEFDLLRFGYNTIINIELKKEFTEKKRIEKQLRRNEYYLSFLDKEIFCYTYVAEDKKLYSLDTNGNLTEKELKILIDELVKQEVANIINIDELFDPSNYLVSPFNSTDVFVEGKYFLTNHQETIRKKVLEMSDVSESSPCYISIYGAAGTGKTLLTYDIARNYINDSKDVIIFHCGNLNEGQKKLRHFHSWTIVPIKNMNRYELDSYDLIIIDEVQRIRKVQLNRILESLKDINIKCIFSYDSKQCLHRTEIENNIPEYINEKVSPQTHRLTEKIRTNEEIASFIKNLFDLSKINPTQKYSNMVWSQKA
jgi:alpha-D-ribose 1-methylphosphonate 5-triphosphate synthase subunit PhnL